MTVRIVRFLNLRDLNSVRKFLFTCCSHFSLWDTANLCRKNYLLSFPLYQYKTDIYLKTSIGIISDFSSVFICNLLYDLHSSGNLPLRDEPTNWFKDTAVMIWLLPMRKPLCLWVIWWNPMYNGVMKITATGAAFMRKKGFQSPSAFKIQGSAQPAIVLPRAIMMFEIRLLLLTSTYSNAKTWVSKDWSQKGSTFYETLPRR